MKKWEKKAKEACPKSVKRGKKGNHDYLKAEHWEGWCVGKGSKEQKNATGKLERDILQYPGGSGDTGKRWHWEKTKWE